MPAWIAALSSSESGLVRSSPSTSAAKHGPIWRVLTGIALASFSRVATILAQITPDRWRVRWFARPFSIARRTTPPTRHARMWPARDGARQRRATEFACRLEENVRPGDEPPGSARHGGTLHPRGTR